MRSAILSRFNTPIMSMPQQLQAKVNKQINSRIK